MDENHDGEYIPYEPIPDAVLPAAEKKSEKKKDPVKKKLIAFGAVTLVLCLLMSFVSGAAGSFLVLSLFSPKTVSKQENTTAENVFVPEYSEVPATVAETTLAPAETTRTASETTVPSSGEPTRATTEAAAAQTTQPVTEAPSKTKGEIYAQAVNSIVCVEARSSESIMGFFGRSYTQRYVSSGSGFFVTSDGYILTNYHVIEGAYEVKVTTYDGTEYPASVTGYEKANDIAVLKADGEFTPVNMGDSSALAVGDDILVIGNALGELSYTFTDGVVSYLNRLVSTDSGAVINMFQTNAAINEGNSGGPVYNMDGEVVGIASAKYASGTVEGLGFCIPVNDINEMMMDIILYGYVTGKPSLGVSVQTVSTAMSYTYNIPTGCYIVAVGSGTAAEAAGLSAGKVITFLDDTRVYSCDDAAAFLSGKKAWDTILVTGSGSEGDFTVQLTLDEYVPSSPRTNYSNVQDM